MRTLGLTRFFSHRWEEHDHICLEMISSFHFGDSDGNCEKVMLCNFNGVLCETCRTTMHEMFGFHVSEDASICAPGNFNYHEACYELTGCNNF